MKPTFVNLNTMLSRQNAPQTSANKMCRRQSQPFEPKVFENLLSNNKKNTNKVAAQYFQQRIQHSPLKVPLSRAIQKTVKSIVNKQNQTETSRRKPKRSALSRINLGDQSQFFLKQDSLTSEDIDCMINEMHQETSAFLKNNFNVYESIKMDRFVDRVVQKYHQLWDNGNEGIGDILEEFVGKLSNALGGQYLDLRLLDVLTKTGGIIGLILKLFKELKQDLHSNNSTKSYTQHPYNISLLKQSFDQRLEEGNSADLQNIKNIIQEFMETMYKCMENEIYSKFNVEMRRMIMKYKETQKILRNVNDKITHNIDVFHADKILQEKQRNFNIEITSLKEKLQKNEIQFEKQVNSSKLLKSQNQKLATQVSKLKQQLQKYTINILNKQNQLDPSLSRHTSQPFLQSISPRRVSHQGTYLEKPKQHPANQYYENSVNSGYGMDMSNYKSTSILTPNLKLNINTEMVKEPQTTTVYFTQRQTTMTPPKITITRVQRSPIKSRVIRF